MQMPLRQLHVLLPIAVIAAAVLLFTTPAAA